MHQQVLVLTMLLEVAVEVLDTMVAVVVLVVMIMEIPLVLLLVVVADQVMFILQYLMDLLEDFLMVRIIQIEEMLERQDKMQR